jgi:hypothetical protein
MVRPTLQDTSQGAVLPDFVLRQFDRGHPDFDHRQRYAILQRGMREAVLPAGSRLPPSPAHALVARACAATCRGAANRFDAPQASGAAPPPKKARSNGALRRCGQVRSGFPPLQTIYIMVTM